MLEVRVALLLAAATAPAACDTAARRFETDGGTSTTCLEAKQHDDLGWIQDHIFTFSCSNFSSCHQGTATQAARLNLEEGRSLRNLVNKPSRLIPWWTLVVPGDPEHSYLMVQLGSIDGPLCASGTMPYNNPLLCEDKRQAIERWILALPETLPDAAPPPDASGQPDAAPPGPGAGPPEPDAGPDAGAKCDFPDAASP